MIEAAAELASPSPAEHSAPEEVRTNSDLTPAPLSTNAAAWRWQPKRLTARQIAVLEMHLMGGTAEEISIVCDVSKVYVGLLINSDRGREFCAKRLTAFDNEFRSLYGNVIQAVRDGLRPDEDIATRLTAADKWLKAHGKYQPKSVIGGPVTAEEIVQKLLTARGLTVNVVNAQNVQMNQPTPPSAELEGTPGRSPEFDFLD